MGLPGFEPGSREPKSPSLDQTSRQPLSLSLEPLQTINDFGLVVKTLARLARWLVPEMVKNGFYSSFAYWRLI